MTDHQAQIDQLRGRQVALIKLLSHDEQTMVLAAAPLSHDDAIELTADLVQVHLLRDYIEAKKENS